MIWNNGNYYQIYKLYFMFWDLSLSWSTPNLMLRRLFHLYDRNLLLIWVSVSVIAALRWTFFNFQISQTDAGVYTLIVTSSQFPGKNATAVFKVTAVHAKSTSTSALIAGICAAGIVGLILFAVLIMLTKRKKDLEKGKLLHLNFNLLP